MQFRDRSEVLKDRIALSIKLDIVFPDNRHSNAKELQTVKGFLKQDNVSFANAIISGLMQHNLFDTEFNYIYFEYDPQSYQALMKACIEDFSKKNDFSKTLEIPSYSKSILQAIIGYEAIFQLLPALQQDNINYGEQLASKLMELCSLPKFSELDKTQQDRVKQMIKSINGEIEVN